MKRVYNFFKSIFVRPKNEAQIFTESQHPVYDIPTEFIENSLRVGITIVENPELKISDVSPGTDLKRMYFVGQGLCLDTKDEFGNEAVITVNWSDKQYGLFSGGPRIPLSPQALTSLQRLMDLCNVNYEKEYEAAI